ncbi:MAG: hypothetical protein JXB35_07585 [Anaerolineae bacterium]|nr:hypothetical protein [Anaerolineae bacterium]
MKSRQVFLILILISILWSCTPSPSPTPEALPTASPTPLPEFSAAESVGRSFLAAWSSFDYAQMYAYLAPDLRAGLSQEDFTLAYNTALNTTTAYAVTAQPQQLAVAEGTGWIDFAVSWETALFGTLQATNQLHLTREDEQWWVEWRREAIWPDLAGANAFAIEYQVPTRANIYDREGAALATLSTIVTVGVIPNQIENEATLLANLSQVLGAPESEIQAAYVGQPTDWFIPIADITGDESLAFDAFLTIPGIERRARPGRLYPLDGVGAHVIGWVAPIPAEEAETYRQAGYRADALVGVAGLEAWGESILSGKNGGRLSLIDADGNHLRVLAERDPERGRPLYTTLDRALQDAVENIVSAAGQPGAAVLMDADTGAILAMVSVPKFNSNVFLRPTDAWQRQLLLNDPQVPLLNRATQGLYPCGSVFKIVTMAAALETGLATPDSIYTCPGYWDGLGAANRKACWLETGHGPINLMDGLAASCDVVFYELGMALDNSSPNLLPEYGAAFGLGAATGLTEIPEAAGLMPAPDWKLETYFENWSAGDSVNLAIGQGYLLVTPLQVVQMLGAVANGGTLYRPFLIDRVGEGSGFSEQPTLPLAQGNLPISEETLARLQTALRAVTTDAIGTASHRFTGLDIPVSGKTGTAEAPGVTGLPHAWFAGYFPAGERTLAAVVMVETVGEGSTVAAPMFRQIVEAVYGLPLTPLPENPDARDGD